MDAILTVVVVGAVFGFLGFLLGRTGRGRVAKATQEDLIEAASFGSWLAYRGPQQRARAVAEWFDPALHNLRASRRNEIRKAFRLLKGRTL